MKCTSLSSLLVVAALLVAVPAAHAQENQPFDEWLDDLRREARVLGISEATLAALDDIEAPEERVLELDGSQPEFVQTFTRYLELRVTPAQVSQGRALLGVHYGLLAEVRRRYQVQPHYLVAFWSIESNFGRATGGFSVLSALATLAHNPRRADFFRGELLTALRIIDEGHISPQRMSGSWAGAMGQLQFLPSTFYRYGVDGDGDGRIDIWNSLPDVFHSAANFLQQSGWKGNERWGREVLLPAGFDYSQGDGRTLKSVREWANLGVRRVNGRALPASDMTASVVLPAGADGPAFLGYDNYRATRRYNPSTFYAVTVGHLADRLTGGDPIQRMPEDEETISVDEVYLLQRLLNDMGYDSGPPDGRIGRLTRRAIRDYQVARNMSADGHATRNLLEAVIAESER